MPRKLLATSFVLLAQLLPIVCQAAEDDFDRYFESLVNKVDALALADNPVWLKMLHYESSPNSGGRSAIVSEGFFLADTGYIDPRAELLATLSGFYEPVGSDPNQHAMCRFPARLHWIRTRIQFAEKPLPRVQCEDLLAWARFGRLQSISVISVNGYFGNPASTFGHLLIKLNNGGDNNVDDLLDTGVNFGAAIPEDESLVAYIGKGLFGGYRASFSDKKFYAQYNVYADSEARDMWEYKLELTHYQERLLVYHLWELVDQEYIYYFLRENCGLRMAEVLEMVLGEDLDADSSGWYLPVTLFHGLQDANDKSGGKLISSVRYIPSKEKQFSTRYAKLSAQQKSYFGHYVKTQRETTGLTEEQKSQVLQTLIAYYQYQLAVDRYVKDHAAIQLERRQIIHRLKDSDASLVSPARMSTVRELPPPTDGSKPNRIGIGAGDKKNGDAFATLRYSAAYFDLIGNNNLDHSELVIMDFEVVANEEDGVELEQLDIISVQELRNDSSGYLESAGWAWRAYAGVNNKTVDCKRCRQLELRVGLGRSMTIGETGLAYALIDAGVETENEDFVLTPSIGAVIGESNGWKTQLELGRQYFSETDSETSIVLLRSKYELQRNHEIRFQFQKNGGERADVSYQYYW